MAKAEKQTGYLVQQDTGTFRQSNVATETEAFDLAREWAREWPGHQVDVFDEKWQWQGASFIKPAVIEPTRVEQPQ